MDPSQVLREAEAHLRNGDLAEAAVALAHYRGWRCGGGFEPPGGNRLADELECRLSGAAPDTVRLYRSCGWCHALNAASEQFCKSCGHEAHVSRMHCRCPRCTRAPEPITAEDIETFLADLRRRQVGTGSNERDPMTPSDDDARLFYLRQFRVAFEQAACKPLPEGFKDAEVEAYRQRGTPAAEAARDFLETYWQGGRLLP